ncbi:50S ribosomal protein L15 [bacterium]|nr:50S ribosomal protein L15 [bacterium]MBU1615003.1 50S ribosomal protein L15 [bacterium]
MELNNLEVPEGARKKKKRIGRGSGSGAGKTSGKGHKGQLARSGAKRKPYFEGGQMPLTRRVPKRGFRSLNRVEYQIVNLARLSHLKEETEVNADFLYEIGLIKKKSLPIKILGEGKVNVPLIVAVDKISAQAKLKVEASGGRVEILRR